QRRRPRCSGGVGAGDDLLDGTPKATVAFGEPVQEEAAVPRCGGRVDDRHRGRGPMGVGGGGEPGGEDGTEAPGDTRPDRHRRLLPRAAWPGVLASPRIVPYHLDVLGDT